MTNRNNLKGEDLSLLSLQRFNLSVIGSVESGPTERQSVITVGWGVALVLKNLLLYVGKAGRDHEDHNTPEGLPSLTDFLPKGSRISQSDASSSQTEDQAVSIAVKRWETFLIQTIAGVPRENSLEDENYTASSQGAAKRQEE